MVWYLANAAIPRLGEVLKCSLLARYEKLKIDKLFGTILLGWAMLSLPQVLKQTMHLTTHEEMVSALGKRSDDMLRFIGEQFATISVAPWFGQLFGWIVGIAVSTGIAYGYGRYFAPHLAHRDRVVRAIATLGLALFLFGGMALYWGVGVARRLALPTDLNFVVLFGVRLSLTRVIALGLSLAMVCSIGLLLSKTRVGLGMRRLHAEPWRGAPSTATPQGLRVIRGPVRVRSATRPTSGTGGRRR